MAYGTSFRVCVSDLSIKCEALSTSSDFRRLFMESGSGIY